VRLIGTIQGAGVLEKAQGYAGGVSGTVAWAKEMVYAIRHADGHLGNKEIERGSRPPESARAAGREW
jgi:hypothetical protein